MKKIIIVTQSLLLGGTEKALVSMLKAIPRNKFSITLAIMEQGGDLTTEIPDWIDIKYIPAYSFGSKELILYFIKKKDIRNVVHSCLSLCLMRFHDFYEQQFYKALSLPKLEGEYDLAISYSTPCAFPDWYTVQNVKAKKKLVWVHSDISKFSKIINSPICNKMYSRYDKIFCVSQDSSQSFKNVFPNLSDKVSVFYNIFTKNEIILNGISVNVFEDDFEGTRILTVGRLSKEKGVDIIPSIVARLKEYGYNIRWYCIGHGSLREKLEEEIKERNLENNVVLLGKINNPFPYYKKCDIYVQPSRFEAYCTTVGEARCFSRPIIATDVAGSREQIKHNYNGLIVSFDEEEILKSVIQLLENKDLCKKFESNLQKEDINTLQELKKLYSEVM